MRKGGNERTYPISQLGGILVFGEDQVLTAKLLPPRLRRHTLVRERLEERLLEALDVPLTIVQAGPGYGKTTALASFLSEQPYGAVWYTVAEGDADPLPFLLHLIYALRMTNPLIGEKALTVLREDPEQTHLWQIATESLINEMAASLRTETFIVLDDFHSVDQSPAVLELVEHLVEHLPPKVHLLLATRRRPPLLHLSKWRARAEVLELGQQDLAFTPAEVEALFRDQYRVEVATDQVDWLVDRTEGWIIALQLIWQGLRKGRDFKPLGEPVPGRMDALFTYLAQEVFGQQKPEVRRFLMTTAVLEELSPEACDALTGEAGSAQVLATLEENGLFVQALENGFYRYHALFHQFLRDKAQGDPETWRENHLRAAAYFRQRGALAEAAHHDLAAGEQDDAALSTLQASRELLAAGRVDVLGGLLDRLGEAAAHRYPELLLRRGDVARLSCHFADALAWYQKAGEAYAACGDRRGNCLALQGQAQVYLDTISPGDAEGLFREALQLADVLSAEERAHLLTLVAENETNRGRPADAAHFASLAAGSSQPVDGLLEVRALLRTGRLAAAMGHLERLDRQGLPGATRNHREVPLLISLIASLTGEQERAQAAAEAGVRLGKEKQSPFVEAVGLIRLGHALQLDPLVPLAEAADCYQRTIALMDHLQVRRGKAEPLAGLCLLYGHVAGDWMLAERYGQEGAKIAETARDAWFHAFCLLALGSSAVVTKQVEAQGYLDKAEAAFCEAGDEYGQALTQVWRAVLALRLGEWGDFDRAVGQALQSAQTNGYSYLLTRRVLYGPRDVQMLIPILREANKRGVQGDYAAWLLAELGISNPEQHPGFTLRLRALGSFRVWRGNQEIARREWQREKARHLLQLLVTQRRRLLLKEQIIDLLWPGLDAETASRDFKVALNALFNALEPNRAARSGSFYIQREGAAYGLDPVSGYWLDVDEFERLITRGLLLGEQGQEQAAAESLRRALDLYQGDYLQDLLYEDWCSEERERLQVLYLRAAEWLAHYACRGGDHEGCIRLCELILSRDHCWEEAYRLLMSSYDRTGNRAMALRTYDKCTHYLQAELGITPMASTRLLYERIRSSAGGE